MLKKYTIYNLRISPLFAILVTPLLFLCSYSTTFADAITFQPLSVVSNDQNCINPDPIHELTDGNLTTYCESPGGGIDFTFDFSQIPQNAVIDSFAGNLTVQDPYGCGAGGGIQVTKNGAPDGFLILPDIRFSPRVVPQTFDRNATYGFITYAEGCGQPNRVFEYSMTVVFSPNPVAITTTVLPDATVPTAYSQTLQKTGGIAPFTWSVLSGSLPAGLSLNSSTGEISGTPTTIGTNNFTVQVTDSNNNSDTQALSIVVHGTAVITLNPSADTYLKQGTPNQNQGTSTLLNLQQSGKNRSLVQFDPQAIQNAVGTGTLQSASLQTHIQSNGGNWGTSGRPIDLDRMTHSWTELGATWNCPHDTNTSNSSPDCTGNTWNMNAEDAFAATPTDSQTITNSSSGTISFNVASDIQAFLNNTVSHYGWIIKKANESQAGQVGFDSRETANSPTLVLTVYF